MDAQGDNHVKGRRSKRDAGAPSTTERLVITALNDSWSTIPAEADLIDRWLGSEIAKLFGEQGEATV